MTRSVLALATMLFLGYVGAALAQEETHLGAPLPIGQYQISATPSVTDLHFNLVKKPNPLVAFPILSQLTYPMPSNTRGSLDQKLYADLSPSVVLILKDDTFGAGVLINTEGQILTNWHVVAGYEFVYIAFKPLVEGTADLDPEITVARIDKIDAVSDLALLTALSFPKNLKPIPLGSGSDIQVGADTHAIGHPSGETWTYTKGLVSQYRREYEWYSDLGYYHKADVIQTQTPINPGNSGGPLIINEGRLIGINSFKSEGELINFAVSIDEIRRFLKRSSDRVALKESPAEQIEECPNIVKTSSNRTDAGDGNLITFDTDCDGHPDMSLTIPDDETAAFIVERDTSGDGKIDTIIIDFDRDEAWDYSLYDYSGNGEVDLIGCHSDGKINPTSLHLYDNKDPVVVCAN